MFCGETKLTKEEKIQLARYTQDSIYFLKNEDGLRKFYPDRYVAIHERKVVDSDIDLELLLLRLREKYGEKETRGMAVEYVWKKPMNYILPMMLAAK